MNLKREFTTADLEKSNMSLNGRMYKKLDLKNKKYSLHVLKDNIYALDLFELLETQILTPCFIAKYVLNNKYQLSNDEEKINMEFILKYQPHITRLEMANALVEYDSDTDSFEDFDSFSRRVD